MAPPPVDNSLGVTALLNELLSEEAKLEIAMNDFTGRGNEEAAADSDQQPEQQLSAEDAQQLHELHQDVDSCLAGLQSWEEESRLRRKKLEEDLAKEYGFSCDTEFDPMPSYEGNAWVAQTAPSEAIEEDEDMSRYLGGAGRREHGQRAVRAPLTEAPVNVASVTKSAKAASRENARQADEDRMSQLRAEVEGMRQREAMGLGPYGGMEPEPDEEDAQASMLGTAGLGLSSWCAEVDAALENPSFITETDIVAPVHVGNDSNVKALESQLEAEIAEMERLLTECNGMMEAQKSN